MLEVGNRGTVGKLGLKGIDTPPHKYLRHTQ
jgi:hypothetical protein